MFAFPAKYGNVDHVRRSGACSLKFCGFCEPEKAGNEAATKGRIRRLPDQAGFGGREEHEERNFFLCVLCVPLWQWRFGASLLPASAKGAGGRGTSLRKSLISMIVSDSSDDFLENCILSQQLLDFFPSGGDSAQALRIHAVIQGQNHVTGRGQIGPATAARAATGR